MYQEKQFENIIGVKGLSEELLRNHISLYQGYVKNTNKLIQALDDLSNEGKADTPEYAELKRRFGWEFNGMRLHEYYFSSISKNASEIDKESGLYKKIAEDFGSYEDWERDFKSTAAIRGIGWAILYYDRDARRLLNVWVNEHDSGHLASALPLLPIDMFEHAYMIDYGLKKADYVSNFLKIIDWKSVAQRFESLQNL
ncbi:MAG: Fe-Mn family superoxide dismutase [Candidatus Pacebacteria bacterium]|nr:Fe-Mn family superoxide dismutase [Candidatus Paceibacterota bacterium]